MSIEYEDKDKTTFTSHLGIYHFKCKPFSLLSVPATFQRALDIILSGVLRKTCFDYIDTVIIFFKNNCQHIENINKVLKLLSQTDVNLKLSNCPLFQIKNEYIGYLFMPGRLAVAFKNDDAIKTAVFSA